MAWTIYAVWTRSAEMREEDYNILIGMYSTRTLALQVARESLGHEEDEYWIKEHTINQFGPGETIWDERADRGSPYAESYRRFWPGGFPTETCPAKEE